MKPRVLFVANARLPTEKAHGHAIVKMCEAYTRIGLDVELWFPRRKQPSQQLQQTTIFDYYGVPEHFRARSLRTVDVVIAESWLPKRLFQFLMRGRDLMWAWFIARKATRQRFALHHTRNVAVAFFLARAGLATLLETHSPPTGRRRELVRRLAKLPDLHGVIALTEACRQTLLALGIPDAKIVVLGSCVDLDSYTELPDATECRAALGLPRDRQIVGYVGRFETVGIEKGIPTLIEGLGIVRRAHELCPIFLCVGGPMDRVPRYVELAREAQIPVEDLYFRDHVPSAEVPTWIGACDIGVIPFPSTPDRIARFASPLKAFEFQAAGVPILASDIPSHREAFTHGESGWLVEPDDPDALARGLARLLTDEMLRSSLGARGKLAVTEHTWVRRAERIWARFGADLISREATTVQTRTNRSGAQAARDL